MAWKNQFNDAEQLWRDRVVAALAYKAECTSEFALGDFTPYEQDAVDHTNEWRARCIDQDKKLRTLEVCELIASPASAAYEAAQELEHMTDSIYAGMGVPRELLMPHRVDGQ